MSSDLDILWEIAQEVAKNSDNVINDYDHYECPYCHEEDSRESNFKIVHKDACIVNKARKLIEGREKQS